MPSKPLACCLLLLASAAVAEEVTVTVTRQDCARLLRHVPAADVAYRPGVGVNGRRVAPADLPGSGADLKVLPDVLEIPIVVEAGNWVATPGVDKSEMTMGTVTYDTLRGTFLFNGRPLVSAEAAELAEACAKRGVKK